MSGHAYTAPALRRRSLAESERWSGPGGALAVAGLCVLALAALWVLANLVPGLQIRDAILLNDFTRLNHAPYAGVAATLPHLLEPTLFVLWGVALVSIAVARDRPRTAAAVALIMGLAPFTSETLKPLLAHHHLTVGAYIPAGSWPSGHSTAALTLGLCVVLVTPARLRRLAAAVALTFAAAVGVSLLIRAWHMPSDVLGGYLVASFWSAMAVFGVRLSERIRPSGRSEIV